MKSARTSARYQLDGVRENIRLYRRDHDMTKLEGRHVLVVEDDPLVAAVWEAVLEQAGAHVIGPFDARSPALAALLVQRPDMAMLDLRLNNGTSLPVARWLADEAVPYCFVSGEDPTELPAEFKHIDFVRKPASLRAVMSALDALT